MNWKDWERSEKQSIDTASAAIRYAAITRGHGNRFSALLADPTYYDKGGILAALLRA